jgi:glycosyltransferase involved in cell wall biosynthesis
VTVGEDYRALDADRYRRYGPLASLVRGVMRLRRGLGFGRGVLRAVEGMRDRGLPEVVHVLDSEYVSLIALLRGLRRFTGTDRYVTLHPSDFGAGRLSIGTFYKRLVRGALRRELRRVFCHGPWIAERLRVQLDLRTEQLVALYYPSEATDLSVPAREARKQLSLDLEARVVLWFGMIRYNKRVDFALRTLALLPENYVLLVAGHPAEIGEEALRAMARQLGVERRVRWYLRYLDEDEIPAFFSSAEVILSTHAPSFTSASGPVSDARSYRRPVVCGAIGQLGAYVEAFAVGRVVPDDEPAAFADAIVEVVEAARSGGDGAMAERIERAATRLSWESFAAAHAQVYLSRRGLEGRKQ